METFKQPTGSPALTGDDTEEDNVPPFAGLSQVRYASEEASHTPGGTMFYGNIEAGHFPHTDTTYRLSFFIRGDASELEKIDPRVVVLSIYVIPGGTLYAKPYNKNMSGEEKTLTEGIETDFLTAPYEVTAGELMDSAGTYRWITTPPFYVPGNVNIAYYAVWSGETTIYCDRMIMFNEFYDRLFNPTRKTNPLTPPALGAQINAKYQSAGTGLHSTYVDKPPLLATEAFALINHLVDSTIGARNSGMELNGAISPHTEWG